MGASEGQTGSAATNRLFGMLRFVGLIIAVCVVADCVQYMAWAANRLPGAGSIGAEQPQFSVDPSAGPGYVKVAAVDRGSPLERAGVVAGDRLRFAPTFDYLRYRRAGETVHATVDRAGRTFPVTMVAAPRSGPPDWSAVLFYLGNLIPTAFGGFILWRSRGRVAAMLLAGALISFGPPSVSAMMWEGGRAGFVLLSIFNRTCIVAVSVFLAAFAIRFLADQVGRLSRWHWIALGLYSGVNLVCLVLWCLGDFNAVSLPLIDSATNLVSGVGYVGFAASMVYLGLAWRRSARAERDRIALFLVGVAAMIVAQALSVVVFVGLDQNFTMSNPLLFVAEFLSGVVAPGLLTHAILRHRVLDLGFILNRTIVFGVVSAVLLIAFGLIEWGVDHLVKIEGRENNALVDAAIALGVYLVFHRFRHVAERSVEFLFFRAWHEKEAGLRRAVANAGFITESGPLIEAAMRAFASFCGGAAVAVYLKDEVGAYALTGGEGAATIDVNEPMVVSMRAESKPVRSNETQRLNADLGLPMMHRNELLGFVLLAAKPGDGDYRVDEVEVLAWAAHQIGLDLHAQEVERLEALVRAQEQRISILEAISASPSSRKRTSRV